MNICIGIRSIRYVRSLSTLSKIPPTQIIYYPDGSRKYEEWKVDKKLHHKNGPAVLRYHWNGKIAVEEWYRHGILHRNNHEPAIMYYDSNGKVRSKEWYESGILHRNKSDGPAVVYYSPNGSIKLEEYWTNGKHINDPVQILKIVASSIIGTVVGIVIFYFGYQFGFHIVKGLMSIS